MSNFSHRRSPRDYDLPKCKVCFIGAAGVGKTSIVKRLVYDRFEIYEESTIGASFMCKESKEQGVAIEIWDTAGQERYLGMLKMYYRDAQVIVAVVSVEQKERTMEYMISQLQRTLTEIVRNTKETKHFIVLINKIEKDEFSVKEMLADRMHEIMTNLRKGHRGYDFTHTVMMVSAATNENFKEFTDELFKKARKHHLVKRPDDTNIIRLSRSRRRYPTQTHTSMKDKMKQCCRIS